MNVAHAAHVGADDRDAGGEGLNHGDGVLPSLRGRQHETSVAP